MYTTEYVAVMGVSCTQSSSFHPSRPGWFNRTVPKYITSVRINKYGRGLKLGVQLYMISGREVPHYRYVKRGERKDWTG